MIDYIRTKTLAHSKDETYSNNLEQGNFRKIQVKVNELIIKNYKYYGKIIRKLFKFLIVFITFLSIYFLYFLSLENCSEGL